MSDDLLEIDVRLLLLRYGRQKVLRALANVSGETLEQIQQQLAAADQRKKAKAKSRKHSSSIMELVATESRERQEIVEPLRALAIEFENRTFLPQLRDVQRFLDRIGAPHGKLKSRTAAAPALVRALAKLSRNDLVQLSARGKAHGESDYSLLARAIMGPAAKAPASHEPGTKPTKS